MKLYSLLVTLDDEKNNVLRQIIMSGSATLEDLHRQIVDAFGLSPGEIASFYKVEGDWDTGEEIPMENFDEKSTIPVMTDITVESFFESETRLLYVYDFFYLWTFFIEKVKLANDVTEPGVVMSVGKLPENAPDKSFEGEESDMEYLDDEDDFYNDEDDLY
jgi:hypothetical protein